MKIEVKITGDEKTQTAGIIYINVKMYHSCFSRIKQKYNLPDTFDFDNAFIEIMEEMLKKITEGCKNKVSNLDIDFKYGLSSLSMPLKDDAGSLMFRIADVRECVKQGKLLTKKED